MSVNLPQPSFVTVAAGVCLAVMGMGCYGLAVSPTTQGAAATSGPGSGAEPSLPDTTQPSTCEQPAPVRSPLRRLTRTEYNETVRDLLGDTTSPANAFVADSVELGFDNNAEANVVSPLLWEQYVAAAETLAERAVGNPSLLPCTPTASTESTCAAAFIESFGRRAFRRPLRDEERSKLLALYEKGRAGSTFLAGVKDVVMAALLSPAFLYRVELGAGVPLEGWMRLSPYELATRLSYLFWGSMPDDALVAAAEANELSTPAEVEAQARRLLASPRARSAVARFHAQWLSLDQVAQLKRDATAYPTFSEAVATSMRQETERFVEDILWNGDGTVGSLLSATHTFVDANLAPLYGLSAVSGWQKVQLDGARRSGLLTQPSTLAVNAHNNQTSPVLRGKFIRERLLCQTLPPPPADVNIELPQLDPTLTTRERFTQHRTDPVCAGCHSLMDPLGLGFEHFDAIGRWRDTENGQAIDTTGTLTGTTGADGPFDGAVALTERLVTAPEVGECMGRQWFRYTFGRAETTADNCTLERLSRTLAEKGGNLRELLVALTQTDAFLYRTQLSQ